MSQTIYHASFQLHRLGGQLTQRDRLAVDDAGETDSLESPKAAARSYVHGKSHQKMWTMVLLSAELAIRRHGQAVEYHDAALVEIQLRYDQATWRCRICISTSNPSEYVFGLVGHCSLWGLSGLNSGTRHE